MRRCWLDSEIQGAEERRTSASKLLQRLLVIQGLAAAARGSARGSFVLRPWLQKWQNARGETDGKMPEVKEMAKCQR